MKMGTGRELLVKLYMKTGNGIKKVLKGCI